MQETIKKLSSPADYARDESANNFRGTTLVGKKNLPTLTACIVPPP